MWGWEYQTLNLLAFTDKDLFKPALPELNLIGIKNS